MGAVNYKTSDYITLGVKPYDVAEMEEYIKANPEEFEFTDEQLEDEDYLNDYVNEYIRDLYDADLANVQSIIDDYSFNYFDVEIEYGYYEGFSLDISPDFAFYDEEDKQDALNEAKELREMLVKLTGVGMVACFPGWATGYKDRAGTLKAIEEAYQEIVTSINNESLDESIDLTEAASVYLPKLNVFLADSDKETVAYIKDVLNKIFMGIKKDYNGYIEGKRPTIKDYGKYKTFTMQIQANDIGKDDTAKKWNFHYPIKDYCKGMGETFTKKINGISYDCISNKTLNTDDVRSGSEFEEMTDQAAFPMVGVYCTGIGGSYKNLSKDLPGNTYSVVVSVPVKDVKEFSNPFMSKRGSQYTFSNDTKDSSGREFTVSYDMGDGEFVIREFEKGNPDTFTVLYKKSAKAFNAFKELVDQFDANTTCAQVENILAQNGVKMEHSWWFNPYTD